jgi:hypothetical protein
MGFLAPLLLAAAAVVAVPLFLHLFHRHESRRLVFPALRYLLRTEREHARRIRMRQLLLLLVRCLAVLLVVAAAARLFVRGRGEAHPPTALVVVLDNSLSSGRVVGEERVLDRLKALALESVDLADPGDRVWVLRAGEPWEVTPPGGPAQARRRIEETEPSAARGDLDEALRRARGLALGASLPAAEIHLLSDLQASGFADGPAPANGLPVVVFTDVAVPGPNHYLRDARVGGGLPPLADRRTEVAIGVGGAVGDTVPVAVRLVLDGRVRGAATVRPGASAVLPVGPFPQGAVWGWAEADPDDLRADDRRWLALEVRPPPTVALVGDPGPFVREALAVLVDGGRVQRAGDPSTADVVLGAEGRGPGVPGPARRALVPPVDPALLPALNRALADAGIAWRLRDAPSPGEARVDESSVPVELQGVRVHRRYLLEVEPGVAEGDVLARLSDGTPWIVAGERAGVPWLLLASPLDEGASTLPVDAAMVPLLEWILSGWGILGTRPPPVAGDPLPLPSWATGVELPDGTRAPVDGTRELRTTRDPGIYAILRGDTVVERVAVNPSVRESLLAPLPRDALRDRVGGDVVVVDAPRTWRREIFTSRQGHELWRPLLAVALLLLLLESWMALSGAGRPAPREPAQASATDARSAPLA